MSLQGLAFRCTFRELGGGRYQVVSAFGSIELFNDMDLYLMGLMPANEVRPQIVVTNAAKIQAARTQGCAGLAPELQPGDYRTYTVNELIATAGTRSPSSATSQKSFRVLTVVVSMDALLTADEMSYYEFFARRIETKGEVSTNQGRSYGRSVPFGLATGNRASITARLGATALPEVNYGGVANAASFDAAALAPGTVATLFGLGLGAGTASASQVPLPTELNGVRVLVDGVAAPLFFVSPSQINFQIPQGLSGVVTVRVEQAGMASNTNYLTLRAGAPGIITYGNNLAVAVDQNNVVISAANPARAGQVITIYAVGLANLAEAIPAGQAAPLDRLIPAGGNSTVLFGEAGARPDFIGLTPGGVGLGQVNVRVPANLAAGTYRVQLQQGAERSNVVNLSVVR